MSPQPLLYSLTTPVGSVTFMPTAFSWHEAISQLFEAQLELAVAYGSEVPFDKLLGQPVTLHITLYDGEKRHLNGIVSSLVKGGSDPVAAPLRQTAYRMQVVPQLWLLTRRTQSRIFQQKSVPDILRAVLQGLNVSYELGGTYEPRDYCVQYRESDFDFASRLMEEEGIFYFFKHDDGKHTLVVADLPQTRPTLPGSSTLRYELEEGGLRADDRVYEWTKSQTLTSGKVTLWDHTFELPHKHLDAEASVVSSVTVGEVTHKVAVGGNDKLELYDFPGGYAKRFDGVASSGSEQPSNVQHIFEDNKRTTNLRLQQVEGGALLVEGASNCRQLIAGHRFTIANTDDGDGDYVLVSVTHEARPAENAVSDDEQTEYSNRFTCVPVALPYRPPRTTPRPFVHGCQTAVVVGPAGEEIYPDKYGRVKVQFHWDREGKNDSNSSCWIRVATMWAGRQWGAVHIPRIGQEVVVDFLEGDPDRPLIVGSVYNADNMPPYTLPANKTQSGIKSRSTLQGGAENFNELRFEDKKGSEQIFLHAEKDHVREVENDERVWVGNDRTKEVDGNETVTVKKDRTETVDKNETLTIHENRSLTVDKDQTVTIHQNETVAIDKNQDITIGENRTTNIGKNESLTVGKDRSTDIGSNDALSIAKKLSIEAGQEIEITTGEAKIVMKMDGTIQISGVRLTVEGMASVDVKAPKVNIKGDGMVQIQGAMVKINGDGMVQVKAPMSQVNGDGLLMAKGGVTMIN